MTITEPGEPQEQHAAPRPKPGPARPGPGLPRPGRPPAKAADRQRVPASDPHRFGRVDPDGTVWLITVIR